MCNNASPVRRDNLNLLLVYRMPTYHVSTCYKSCVSVLLFVEFSFLVYIIVTRRDIFLDGFIDETVEIKIKIHGLDCTGSCM